MNRIITNSKSKILNFLVIISTSLFCVFIQSILFFLDKSIYLGSFLMLLATVFFIFIDFLDKEILILDGLFFIICPILLILGEFDFSNYIALNIVSLSFLFVIAYLFREKLISSYNRLRNGNLRKIFKCILISLSIIFIILSIFTNQEKTKQVFLKIFNPEEYFKEIDKIEINGFEYTNKMNVTIDSPKNDAEISGLFALEGWAAELTDIEDASIDKIYIYLNNKPEDGGIFLGRVDTKIRREDVADRYGQKYKDAGYYIEINSRKFKNGLNKIYIYAHSNYFNWK